MLASELIAKLAEVIKNAGDVEVLIDDRNGELYPVNLANFHVAEEDEFPEDWNMSAGFEFIRLSE